MSLIQDALKRKSEETPVPDIPSPVVQSEPASPPAGEKSPKMPQLILLLLLLAALLAALIGYSLHLIKQKPLHLPLVVKKPAPAAPAVPKPVAQAPTVEVPAPIVQVIETAKVATVVDPVKNVEPAPESKLIWPELKLTGIASSGSQQLAILNGKTLPSGRKLGEVTIVQVQEQAVVVEYCGERRVLYIGE
jgi:hypothetical protein